jgi:hypothetical protein
MNHYTMVDDTKSILLGTMLGDGYIAKAGCHNRTRVNYSFGITHSVNQMEYLKWKREKMARLNPSEIKIRSRESFIEGRSVKSTCGSYNVYSNEMFKPLHEIFYCDGRKIITDEIMNMMDLQSIAVWYMDDGNYKMGTGVSSLYTYCFTLGEHHLLVNHITRLTGVIPVISRKRADSYYLYFPMDETLRLLSVINKYIPQETGMRYKIPVGWELVRKIGRAYRRNMPARVADNEAKRLIIDNMCTFYSDNSTYDGFPFTLYQFTKGSYSHKAIVRVFGSVTACLYQAELPSNLV